MLYMLQTKGMISKIWTQLGPLYFMNWRLQIREMFGTRQEFSAVSNFNITLLFLVTLLTQWWVLRDSLEQRQNLHHQALSAH